MDNWVKRRPAKTLEDVVRANLNTGTLEDLMSPRMEDPRRIHNLYEAAEIIVFAIQNKTPITIVGDYDSDGLNAAAILVKLFRHYSVVPTVVIPRRKTDGYGLSQNIVEKIQAGLVVTIDNGIAAVEQIQSLKDKDCQVVVLDHHLPGNRLPPADVLVDPHVEPEKNGFLDYCGAGLGYQLVRLLLENDASTAAKTLLDECAIHAAIATVTDVMPLVGVNRRIVMDGLALYNDTSMATKCGAGLVALRTTAQTPVIDETAVGFRLGPIINAPARLYDGGGSSVLKALVCKDFIAASGYAKSMVEINETRKKLVQEAFAKAIQKIEAKQLLSRGNPLVITMGGIEEGVVGILAGKLAEKYKRSAFVFTQPDPNSDIMKGSGRAYGTDDLSLMLKAVEALTENCGGHTGAAGVTIRMEHLTAFADTLQGMGFATEEGEQPLKYDLDIDPDAVSRTLAEQKKYAPFGEGNPKPVFRFRCVRAIRDGESHYRFIGANASSVKFRCEGGFDVIGFGLAEKYRALKAPVSFDVLGTIGENYFNGQTTTQIEAIDIQESSFPL